LTEDLFGREIISVTELTGRLRDLIETGFGLVWVAGEISNLRQPSSGHYYFTLKDRSAQIRAVMFRIQQRYLGFEPADGQEVLVRGRLSVYELRGEYQILVDYMEPRGEGALRLALEKLKAALDAEGLFDPARKKKLPFLPRRVALVTSPTGAAVRDFIRVARRRFEYVTLSIYPVRVQGEGAAQEIAQALADLNRWGGYDLIVLTRGGGSLEDLWAFNEEIVARAIAASDIPVVSAVGHEIDFTIADFAADLRAPTPSAAAELIFRERAELSAHLTRLTRGLTVGMSRRTGLNRERLIHLRARLGDPRRTLADRRLRLDDLTATLARAAHETLSRRRQILSLAALRFSPVGQKARLNLNRTKLGNMKRSLIRSGPNVLDRARGRWAELTVRLDALSPLGVLERGYALARKKPALRPLRTSREVSRGDRVNLLLAQGELDLIVDEVLA